MQDESGKANLPRKRDLPAGAFSAWLERTRSALRNRDEADVPCGECNACCRSSYFIHIDADEGACLARIPAELLVPAPGRPAGTMVLGYDENGHCPMLVDGRCSIYAHRPRTCRSYDCRIFAAAGIPAGGDDKAAVTEQTLKWEFGYPAERDRVEHLAVRAAAKDLREHTRARDEAPDNATGLALQAIMSDEEKADGL